MMTSISLIKNKYELKLNAKKYNILSKRNMDFFIFLLFLKEKSKHFSRN